jgi:hypothetical protein
MSLDIHEGDKVDEAALKPGSADRGFRSGAFPTRNAQKPRTRKRGPRYLAWPERKHNNIR